MSGQRVAGKVIVVTGASSGQGAAEAAALASEGAHVLAVDIQEPRQTLPAGVEFRSHDISHRDHWVDLARHLHDTHGRVDGLVNNAATTSREWLLDVTDSEWSRVLNVNVDGALYGIQTLAPLMPRGASITNVCSLAALTGHPTASYTVSKWALRGLSRVASLELGRMDIRVNAIFPGYVDTPMVQTAPPAFKRLTEEQIPLGRVGFPEDIAPLVVFLQSPESSWMSGAEIAIDGGEWAHGGAKVFSDGLR